MHYTTRCKFFSTQSPNIRAVCGWHSPLRFAPMYESREEAVIFSSDVLCPKRLKYPQRAKIKTYFVGLFWQNRSRFDRAQRRRVQAFSVWLWKPDWGLICRIICAVRLEPVCSVKNQQYDKTKVCRVQTPPRPANTIYRCRLCSAHCFNVQYKYVYHLLTELRCNQQQGEYMYRTPYECTDDKKTVRLWKQYMKVGS